MSPSWNSRSLIALGLAALLIPAGCETRAASLTKKRIKGVEKGLLRAVVIKGTTPEKMAIKDRMAFYKVPGVSIAVIDRYGIEWAKGYGTKDLQALEPVTPETIFQAGSLMRPLLAAAVLSLAEKGKFAPDADPASLLRSWTLPRDAAYDKTSEPMTLSGLLARSAGLSGPASPGLPRQETIPGLAALAAGLSSKPLDPKMGLMAIQQALVDRIGVPFPAIMDAAVFLPASMSRSVCEVPLPAALEPSAAFGHLRAGPMVEGGWLNYPVAAADGLWTTPSDYALFLDAVVGDAMGRTASILSASSARTLLAPPAAKGNLGFVFEGAGNDAFFRVQGRTVGYTANACFFPAKGQGAVILTNSDNGGLLTDEILRAVAAAYQWPYFAPEEKTLFRLDPSIIEQYVGSYQVTPDYFLQVSAEDYYLVIEPTGQARTKFYVESGTIFFSIDPFIRIQFRRDDQGRVNGLVLWQEDFEQKAVKVR
jgi:CubicO group peptidase (beta-lactamase class C family)